MILLSVIPVLYFSWILFILFKWIKLHSLESENYSEETISVIIPVRNEESNIGALLEDLDRQDFPSGKLTVWVLDDDSTDRTAEIVESLAGKVNYSLQYINGPATDPDGKGGKKNMITLGVNLTHDPIIIQTDGDCRVGPQWVYSMIAPFNIKEVKFSAGPVCYIKENNFFHHMLQQELSALLVTSAAMIALDKPIMCNGACMAYRREAFLNAGGYSGNEDIASGDDSFLMHSIHRISPGSVVFLKNKNAVVYTREPAGFKEFLHQRIRWAGKWNAHNNLWTRTLAIFIFFTNLDFLLLAVFSIMSREYRLLFILMAGKLLMEYLLLHSWIRYFRLKFNVVSFIAAGILYPFYAFIFGVMANTSKFTWKGRNYRNP